MSGVAPVLVVVLAFMLALGLTAPVQLFADGNNGDNVESSNGGDSGDGGRAVILAGCLGCHRINKRGSSLARPLLKLYRKFDKEKFLHQLKEPPTGMPNYNHLSDEMRESIFTYFITSSKNGHKK